MELLKYNEMAKEERDSFLKKFIPDNTRSRASVMKYKRENSVSYVDCLYSNKFFWSGKTDSLTITLDDNNILNGKLESRTKEGDVECYMEWTGYVSQIYDGQVYMTALFEDSKIEGTVEKKTFSFKGIDPQGDSPWPGFLVLFEPL